MIRFHGNKAAIRSRQNKFKKVIHTLIEDHDFLISEINYIFVSDNEILEINKKSLNHDYFTDIITFDLSEGIILEGEIYISLERVKENAMSYNQEFHVELLRVVLHGILHMLGYKDKLKKEKDQMRYMEEKYIKLYQTMFHVETKA